MIQATVYDLEGKAAGKISLPEEYFGAKVNKALLAQARRVYLSNQRQAHAKVKTRSGVDRTKAKWFRQKGTGRARHGSRSAPIFVGGGVAHGPTGTQNYKMRLPTKMRKMALASALTTKVAAKEVMVAEGLEKLTGKTGELIKLLREIFPKEKGKISLVLAAKSAKTSQAARNIANLNLGLAKSLNAYEILASGKILFSREAIEAFKKK